MEEISKDRVRAYLIVASVACAIGFSVFAIVFGLSYFYVADGLTMPLIARVIYSFLIYVMPTFAQSYSLHTGVWFACAFLWYALWQLAIVVHLACFKAVRFEGSKSPTTRFIAEFYNYIEYDSMNVHTIRFAVYAGFFALCNEPFFALMGLQQEGMLRAFAFTAVAGFALLMSAEPVLLALFGKRVHASNVRTPPALLIQSIIACVVYAIGFTTIMAPFIYFFNLLPGLGDAPPPQYWALMSVYTLFFFAAFFLILLCSMNWFNRLTNKLVMECIATFLIPVFGVVVTSVAFNYATHSTFTASSTQRFLLTVL